MTIIDDIYKYTYKQWYQSFAVYHKALKEAFCATEAWYSRLMIDGSVYNLPILSKGISEIWYAFDDKVYDKSYSYTHMLNFGKNTRYTDILTKQHANDQPLQFERYLQHNATGFYHVFIKYHMDASISLLGFLTSQFINMSSLLNQQRAEKILTEFENFFWSEPNLYEACNITKDLIITRKSPDILQQFFLNYPEIHRLSVTDVKIIKALYFGTIHAGDIAIALHKSRRTIENRLEYIRECLQCQNKFELYHLIKSTPEVIAYVFVRLRHIADH
ncbi:hypothetical protein [Facilibium subflavum]|uniref:hypothetical protein n=1 Tax=Facilibium subflavum TaxID=2219058 RepID=UPI000E64C553|nr:hypothetical protein [Facilibium subflavum]